MVTEGVAYEEMPLRITDDAVITEVYYLEGKGCLYASGLHRGLSEPVVLWESADEGSTWEEAFVLPEELASYEATCCSIDSQGNMVALLGDVWSVEHKSGKYALYSFSSGGSIEQLRGLDSVEPSLEQVYLLKHLSDDRVLIMSNQVNSGTGNFYLYDLQRQEMVACLDVPEQIGYYVGGGMIDEDAFVICGENGCCCFDIRTGKVDAMPDGLEGFLNAVGPKGATKHLSLLDGKVYAVSVEGVSSFDCATGEMLQLGTFPEDAFGNGEGGMSRAALAKDGTVFALYFEGFGSSAPLLSRFDPVG